MTGPLKGVSPDYYRDTMVDAYYFVTLRSGKEVLALPSKTTNLSVIHDKSIAKVF